jgi:hypothetical protein
MKKIIFAASSMVVVTLAVYFGVVAFGMGPELALVFTTVVLIAASIFTTTSTTSLPVVAFTASAAVTAAIATTVDFVFIFVIATFSAVVYTVIVAYALIDGFVCADEKEGASYWKVVLVYLVEAAGVGVPIWLHLRGLW